MLFLCFSCRIPCKISRINEPSQTSSPRLKNRRSQTRQAIKRSSTTRRINNTAHEGAADDGVTEENEYDNFRQQNNPIQLPDCPTEPNNPQTSEEKLASHDIMENSRCGPVETADTSTEGLTANVAEISQFEQILNREEKPAQFDTSHEQESALGIWLIAQGIQSKDMDSAMSSSSGQDSKFQKSNDDQVFGGIDSIVEINLARCKSRCSSYTEISDTKNKLDYDPVRARQTTIKNNSSCYPSVVESIQPSPERSQVQVNTLTAKDLENLELCPFKWHDKSSIFDVPRSSESRSSYDTAPEAPANPSHINDQFTENESRSEPAEHVSSSQTRIDISVAESGVQETVRFNTICVSPIKQRCKPLHDKVNSRLPNQEQPYEISIVSSSLLEEPSESHEFDWSAQNARNIDCSLHPSIPTTNKNIPSAEPFCHNSNPAAINADHANAERASCFSSANLRLRPPFISHNPGSIDSGILFKKKATGFSAKRSLSDGRIQALQNNSNEIQPQKLTKKVISLPTKLRGTVRAQLARLTTPSSEHQQSIELRQCQQHERGPFD